MSEPRRSAYDAIVIGAGPAGCVAARRLADSGRATLLIEAGPGGVLPPVLRKAAVVDPGQVPSWFWPSVPVHRARPGETGDAPAEYWTGRGIGGGSLVNGTVLSPGDAEDFNRWRDEHGCRDWGSEKLERRLASAARAMTPGGLDPFEAEPGHADVVEEAFDRAAGHLGHGSITGSTLHGGRRGLLRPATASVGGDRLTVAEAMLPRPTDQTGLEVVSGRMANVVRIRRRRVSAVVLEDGSALTTPAVVCAAGAIQSPALLVRSGVTASAGGRLKNHASFVVTVPWPGVPSGERPVPERRVRRVLRWQTESTSSTPPTDLTAYLIGPVSSGPGAKAIIVVMLSVVRSVGRLHITETTGPTIESAHLTDPVDLAAMRHGIRHVARLCTVMTAALGVEPAMAGDGNRNLDALVRAGDSQLDYWLRTNQGPVYHAVATCAMGPAEDQEAVCWAESGRAGVVRGVEGLVVADGSIFPDLVVGGLQLPIMAVADRVVSESLCQSA